MPRTTLSAEAKGAFSAVSAGHSHYVCGLRIDGTLECWDDTPAVYSPDGVHWECSSNWVVQQLSDVNIC